VAAGRACGRRSTRASRSRRRCAALLDGFRLEDVGSHLMRRAHFMAEELFSQEFASESMTPRQKAALITSTSSPG
jgi:hypothetical protein